MNSSRYPCRVTDAHIRLPGFCFTLLFIGLGLGASAIQGDQRTPANPNPLPDETSPATRYKDRAESPPTLPPGLTRAPVAEPTAPVAGEVPDDIMEAIMADLIAMKNIRREEIEVIRAEAVIWPDGSLGCARAGEMVTQAPVDGYRVMLRWAEKDFDYRVSAKGMFLLCTNAIVERKPVG